MMIILEVYRRDGTMQDLAIPAAPGAFAEIAEDHERAPVTRTRARVVMPEELASCGHPRNADGECGCASWPERAI